MTGWTALTLRARISHEPTRLRHPAGSPDGTEVAAYQSGLPAARGLAVVLGMTPELRTLAAAEFARVVSIDVSEQAIALYASWLAPDARRRETVVRADWQELAGLVDAGSVDAVLGDGVFGNVSLAEHVPLLAQVREALAPEGRLLLRQALVPRGLDLPGCTWRRLRDRFRAGRLDEAGLGLGVRVLGHLSCCWDEAAGRLDNPRLFAETARQRDEGCWTEHEYACIQRYRFGGTTLLLPEQRWEDVVREAGFDLQTLPTSGRDWYRYYPVQQLVPRVRQRRAVRSGTAGGTAR
jgi:SAM-dependent methyltransferase